MRIIFIFFLCSISATVSCQQVVSPQEDTTVKFRKINAIPAFIDSLKQKIKSDTSKFKKEDIVITEKGLMNNSSYSPLFIINFRYQYKLDIIEGKDVLLFLNEMLKSENIVAITVYDPQDSIYFGEQGINGVVFIIFKDTVNPNFNIAGFKTNGNGGNNFH